MILTPSQSIVLRNIEPKDKYVIEGILKEHGVKMANELDAITRKSIACPAFPLCGLAMAEAERVQPEINQRPNMAELALVGSGPKTYQLWLGGSPAQTRTAIA